MNCLAMLTFLLKFDAMQPHQSYLILKQREMVTHGLDDKDLRLLDTIDNTTVPSPMHEHVISSLNRNPYQSGGLFYNASMHSKEPKDSF